MAENGTAVIPVVSYKLTGDYSIISPIDSKDVPDINRRAAIIMACQLFYYRNFPPYYPSIPKSRDESFKGFLGYVAASIYEHLQSDYLMADKYGFFKFLNSDCHIVDKEQAYNWLDDTSLQMHRLRSATGCVWMATSNPPISRVGVNFDVSIKNISTSREQPQYLLGRQIVPKPHDSWTELIENVNKVHQNKKYKHFQELVADKVILTSMGYRNIAYLPPINELAHHDVYPFIYI